MAKRRKGGEQVDGEKLRNIMDHNKLSIEHVAENSECSTRQIQRMRAGKRARITTIQAVAKCIDVDFRILIKQEKPLKLTITITLNAESSEQNEIERVELIKDMIQSYLQQKNIDANYSLLRTTERLYREGRAEFTAEMIFLPWCDRELDTTYAYVIVFPGKYVSFINYLAASRLERRFCFIVKKGYGHPSKKVMRKIKETYGFDHKKSIEFNPKAERKRLRGLADTEQKTIKSDDDQPHD